MSTGIVQLRENLADAVNRAAYGKERVPVMRRGKKVAYIVPLADVEALERIEDQIDLEEGLKALEAIKAGKEVPVPIEEALKRIGYKPRKRKARARK